MKKKNTKETKIYAFYRVYSYSSNPFEKPCLNTWGGFYLARKLLKNNKEKKYIYFRVFINIHKKKTNPVNVSKF